MPSLDFRNTNSLWCSVLVETLAASGVRHAVISPGSRSAPLTFALARHDAIAATPVLDERSASFFALGLAKRSGRPVALVCTSGTAAANFLPAVVEAAESGVPLVVLTADRPPELRDCRSGQTIDQQKIYGRFPVFAHELAVPQATLPLLRYLRQTVAHAVARAASGGPVHLNCPFRDPLPPVPEAAPVPLTAADFDGFFAGLAEPGPAHPAAPARLPRAAQKGLIVVGSNEPASGDDFADAVGRLARALGWPVLADALSPLRSRAARVPHLVVGYDALLRDADRAAALRPQHVLCVGGWPTSKVLRGWLQQADPRVTFVSSRPDNADGLHARATVVRAEIGAWARGARGRRAVSAYGRAWVEADRAVTAALRRGLAAEAGLIEPKWPRVLAAALPAGTPVFLANSMPVRDAEYFWPAGNRAFDLHFNRGANGIDGTLSTALGVAQAAGRPAVLVTGDLAFLHDANGLLLAPRFRGGLTVLLINNDGGGIFEHLPVAQFDPPFEDFFATPQQVDFAGLAAAHNVPHAVVRDEVQLARLCARLPEEGIRVLELRTTRKYDAAFRKHLFAGL